MNNEVQFKMSQILSETDYQLSHFAKGPLAYELQGAAIIWKFVVWYLLQKLIRYNLESSFDLYLATNHFRISQMFSFNFIYYLFQEQLKHVLDFASTLFKNVFR